jgi:hypothetical protein
MTVPLNITQSTSKTFTAYFQHIQKYFHFPTWPKATSPSVLLCHLQQLKQQPFYDHLSAPRQTKIFTTIGNHAHSGLAFFQLLLLSAKK